MHDPMHFEFDNKGVLYLVGRDDWKEAICPKCNEPIPWVLDMMSFLSPRVGDGGQYGYPLAHARCAWIPGAFLKQYRRAQAVTRKLLRASKEE